MKYLSLVKKISLRILRGFEILLLVACLYLASAGLYFRYKFDLKQADDILVYSLFWWTEGTIWASGFSEEAFGRVEVGMKEEDVLKLLGQPLRINTGCLDNEKSGIVEFQYAIQGPICCKNIYPGNHQRRTIIISRRGTVLRKSALINFD